MIPKLKNIPVRELIRALERDGFQYKRPKEVKESTATLRVAVLSSIITTLKIPYPPAHSEVSWMGLDGMKMISDD